MPRAKAQPNAKPKASPFAQRIVADMREHLVKELGKPAKPIALHEMIRVDDIWQAPDQRPIDPRALDLIMETIRVEGLQSPVLVQKTKPPSQAKGKGRGRGRRRPDPIHDRPYELVYGGHRLQAFRSLGHKRIPARVLPENANKDEVYRLSILENLARAELTPAERDEAIRRWMSSAFWGPRGKLALKSARGARPKNWQPSDKGISELSRITGLNRRTIQRAMASLGLTPAARDYAINHGLHKNEPLLRQVSKLPTPKQQVEALEKAYQTEMEQAVDRLTPEARDFASQHFDVAGHHRPLLSDITKLPAQEQLKTLEKIVFKWQGQYHDALIRAAKAFELLDKEGKAYANYDEEDRNLLDKVRHLLGDESQLQTIKEFVNSAYYANYLTKEKTSWVSKLSKVWFEGRPEWRVEALEKMAKHTQGQGVPTVVAKAFRQIAERWSRFPGQNGGLAKVDSGFDYAANFSCSMSIA